MSKEFTPTSHNDASSWINDYFAQIGRMFGQRFIPGYGGFTNNNVIALNDINTTPQNIPADAGAVNNPQGIIQDVDNDSLIILRAGIWTINFRFSLQFTDVNQGRTFTLQFYNNATSSVVRSGNVYVGRNQEGIFPTSSLLAEVNPPSDAVQAATEVRVGDSITARIFSTTDTFENVTVNFYSSTMIYVDQLRFD